jgi:methionyl aminopeptidase
MISIKSAREIELMKDASRIIFKIVKDLVKYIKPGLTTKAIDEMVRLSIVENGGRPAFFGYKGFPGNACISVNDELVHGIPGLRKLKDGDIVSVDIGTELGGYFADGALTLPVGEISKQAERLLQVTKDALRIGIQQARPGNRLSNLSHAIQEFVEANGFSVIRDFVGHGIGSRIHEDPAVPNFGSPNQGPELTAGMVLAIEPMVAQGGYEVRVLDDGWTVVTSDGNLSAHFEDTVAITENGPEVLTGISTL